MKKFYILFIAVFAAFLTSCVENASFERPEGVRITFSIDGAVMTKATADGVSELNENKIKTIRYYVFAQGDTTGTSILNGSQSVDADAAAKDSVKVYLDFTLDEFAANFQGETRTIVVVANAPADSLPKGNAKLADIKKSGISIANGGGKQDSFVMMGQGDIKDTSSSGIMQAEGKVTLKRVISKITFKANVRKFYDIKLDKEGNPVDPGAGGGEGTGDEDWGDDSEDFNGDGVRYTPLCNQAEVTFYNAGKTTDVAGTPATKLFDFTTRSKTWAVSGPTDDNKYICVDSIPFYSYPREWKVGSEDVPYMIIMLPWTTTTYKGGKEDKDTPSSTVKAYYKVVFSGTKFESNKWYNMTVNLGKLGSFVPEKPLEIKDLTLNIAKWVDSADAAMGGYNTDAEIKDVRVLDIPQDTVVLYNTTSASIAYYTSHDCVITSVKVSYKEFTNSAINPKSASATVPAAGATTVSLTLNDNKLPKEPATFTLKDGAIEFSHELKNKVSTSAAFDFQDYFYEITIKHKDNPNYTEKLVIQQKPALSVDAERNSGPSSGAGTVKINNNTSSSNNWNTVVGLLYSKCEYMYVVSVSQLDDASQQVGDPRSSDYKSASQIGINTPDSVNAPSYDSANQRGLLYYYGTDSSKADVIAPKYRICSSYGSLSGNTINLAQAGYRCATYQEEGRPAGRWRLPTDAELKFIGTLCAKKVIPELFYDRCRYWSSTTAYQYNSTNGTFSSTTNSSAYVRCVYDEWYWENSEYATVPNNQFTWGDMKREDFK